MTNDSGDEKATIGNPKEAVPLLGGIEESVASFYFTTVIDTDTCA